MSSFGALAAANLAGKARANIFSNPSEIRPYGADCLQDTDPKLFKISMLDQMRAKGLRRPSTYEPFPAQGWATPGTDFDDNSVYGETADTPALKLTRDYLNVIFPDQPPCTELITSRSIMAWRTVIATHETIHPVAAQPLHGALSINDDLFNSINKISGRDPETYLKELADSNDQEKNTDALLVAEMTLAQVPELTADAGMALYLLSNYGDRDGTLSFLDEIIKVREATYQDIPHDTAPSLRAAISAFLQNPVHGLTIWDAPHWAGQIIKDQPEYAKSIDDIAVDIRDKIATGNALLRRGVAAREAYEGSESDGKNREAAEQPILDARKSVCPQMPAPK